MAKGQQTKSERQFQIIPETTPGTYNGAATPILCRNFKHDWQEESQYDEHTGSGRNLKEFTAVTEEEIRVSGEMVLYYSNIDSQLLQWNFPTPSGADDATASSVRTRNYKYPLTGRIDRKFFSMEEGPTGANAARRSTYSMIPEVTITSERGGGGKTRANISIIGQKPTEGITLTAGGTAPAILPILPKHFKVYRASTLAGLTEPEAFIGTLNRFELAMSGLISTYYSKDRTGTYSSHVDGGSDELNIGLKLWIPTDEDGHCSTMLTGAKSYISAADWYLVHAVSPTTPYEVGWYFHGSVGESIPFESNGNIVMRQFPITLIDNPTDGYSFAVKTKVPA